MLRHAAQLGGVGTYTRSLVEQLLRQDRDNHYVLLYADPALLGSHADPPRVIEEATAARSSLVWDQWTVPAFVRKHRLDLVFNPKLSVPLLARCRKIFVMHGGEWFVFPENYSLAFRLYHRIFGPLYCRSADAFVAATAAAADDIALALACDRRKIRAIHHGVDPRFRRGADAAEARRLRQAHGLPERYALWVGQIYPMKNLGGLIRAFRRVRDQFDCGLVIAGKPHLKAERDLAFIGSCGLERDVVRLGWVPDEDLPALYRQAAVFAFPSLYEGFGIPIIEAMASGCPVVTSNRGAPAEVAGDAALLVDPEDDASIAAGICRVLGDATLGGELVARGRRRAESFTWERCAAETLALFREVAASR
jgi:glycosyltransferase involved in cell wall biosynthesis